MEYKKNKVMAYKQNNNPFKKIKKIDMSAGAFNPDVDFGASRHAQGPYSTADGDLMSGKKDGYGVFGNKDTKIGGRRKSGEQEVYEGYTAGGVGRDIDRSNKGQAPVPEFGPREGQYEREMKTRKANKVDPDAAAMDGGGNVPSKPAVEASMPAVDVTAEGPEKAIPSNISRGDYRRQKRAEAQARRQERRASRQKARQDRRQARRDAREQRRQQRQAARANRRR